MSAPLWPLYRDAENLDGCHVTESNTHVKVGLARLASSVTTLVNSAVRVGTVWVFSPRLETLMSRRPPRQLLSQTILMESEPSTTVASVCRRHVNLTANGRTLPAGWTPLFDEEVIVCSHVVRSGLTIQLTDGGPSVTAEMPSDVVGLPFGAAP